MPTLKVIDRPFSPPQPSPLKTAQEAPTTREDDLQSVRRSREEILAQNPIVAFLQGRGVQLFSVGENFETGNCPVAEHKKLGHHPVSIEVAKQVWYCNDHQVGGSVIDWVMHERGCDAVQAMQSLNGATKSSRQFVCAYDYVDENGKLLFQSLRYKVPPPKNKVFKQRRPGPNGDWVWDIKGVRSVPYRLPEVIKAQTVCVVEGEKDADNLAALGFTTTTNSMGAGKWRKEHADALKGKNVVVFGDIGDPDRSGEKHTDTVLHSLVGLAKSLKHAKQPKEFHDVSDWIAALRVAYPGEERITIQALIDATAEFDLEQYDKPLPKGISLIELADMDPAQFEKDTLLGNRWLCRGGAALWIAPSGIGKSAAAVQMDILWSLGRAAFGIKPKRPLKILCVQAENDNGDLHEMAHGVCSQLQLSEEQREMVRRNVLYIEERALTGEEFLRLLWRLIKHHRCDLARIDPLTAYVGGDVIDPAITVPFLRNGLNRILADFHCGMIVNHHTPKTNRRDTTEWTSIDWVYAGAGNADITNWARGILVADATKLPGLFRFHAAKRGTRIGWSDDDGNPVIERLFAWHSEAIFWRNATEEDVDRLKTTEDGGKRQAIRAVGDKDDLFELIPETGSIEINVLLQKASDPKRGDRRIGLNRARAFLTELLEDGDAFEWRIKRTKMRDQINISRQEQTIV